MSTAHEQLLAEIEAVRAEGFEVKVSPYFLARVKELGNIPGEWDLADQGNSTLITVSRNGVSVWLQLIGEFRVWLNAGAELVEKWRNCKVPEPWLGYLKKHYDTETFEHEGVAYNFEVTDCGWFEVFEDYDGNPLNEGYIVDCFAGPRTVADWVIEREQELFWDILLTKGQVVA